MILVVLFLVRRAGWLCLLMTVASGFAFLMKFVFLLMSLISDNR